MRIAEPVEDFGFTAKVGPGAPFVVPRVLQRPGVVAVVSELPVGRHTGYLIAYYAPHTQPPPGTRINEWGLSSYRVRRDDGTWGWDTAADFPLEWDFDLEPWLEAGKLRWVPPEDPGADTRRGARGCPYVGMRGPHALGVVSYGELRYGKLPSRQVMGDHNPNEP